MPLGFGTMSRFPTDSNPPKVVVLAGPNGVGKSTSAAKLLIGTRQVREFVNGDAIAQGLSGFAPQDAAVDAGRVMLNRLDELAAQRTSFAFETTLASRSFAPRLERLQAAGYAFHLFFLWLPSAEMAIARVADRVRAGGHNVPEPNIRRRYLAGLRNLRTLYLPLANSWDLVDNTRRWRPSLIASGTRYGTAAVYDETAWQTIMQHEEPT
jgi:predicted ABC-type ATPase